MKRFILPSRTQLLSVTLSLGLLAGTVPAVFSAPGILIRKPYANAQNKDLFKAQPYENLEVVGGNAYSLDLPDEPPKRLSSALVADSIDFPSPGLLNQVTTDAQAANIKAELNRLQTAAQRWPVAAPHLREHINTLQTAVQNLERGKVRVGGEWIEKGSMNSVSLRNGETVTFRTSNVEGLELAADTASGIRRIGFFQMLPDDRREYFPEFAELFEKAQGGDQAATEKVALRLYNADVGRDRFEYAARFLEDLANAGDDVARYRLALMKQNGLGIDRNLLRARDLYRVGSEAGFLPAILSYGFALHYGFGQEPDPEQALRQFQKAADQGDPTGQYFVALFTAHGIGTEADEEQALELLKQAAAGEEPWALNDLALCSWEGTVVERDQESALEGWQLSAGLGCPAAENNYGVALVDADAEGNAELALNLFRSASGQGYPPAQYNLAMLLKTGTGAEQNLASAQNYLRLARQGGVEDAEKALENLNDGSTSLRAGNLLQETEPSWKQEGKNPLEYRLTLIRKNIEQPWLPGGDAEAELRKLEEQAASAELGEGELEFPEGTGAEDAANAAPAE
jgi:hypothetical protein